jgi:hypothetical protein
MKHEQIGVAMHSDPRKAMSNVTLRTNPETSIPLAANSPSP